MSVGPRSGRSADPARLAAARVLHAVFTRKAYANLSSLHLLKDDKLNPRDRAFASALIYGTISRIYSIDWLVSQVSERPLDQVEPWVRTILRLGAWQLYWSASVPPSAAVDESVRLVRALTRGRGTGYVNALLRRLSQEKPSLPFNKPAVLYSLSSELYGYLKKWYGEEAPALAASFLAEKKQISIRTNIMKLTPAQLIGWLSQEDLQAEPGLFCPEALQVALAGNPVDQSPSWQRGEWLVQDEAAMLAAYALDPKPGQTIIDLCAAPGGKTTHLAEKTAGQANILAYDHNPQRLELLRQHVRRLGHQGIDCRLGDATGLDMDPGLAGQADRVLLDAPCSGLGLLARKPELRLTMNHQKIISLYPLQARMLDYAASLVRTGGSLVYSTCTINPAENIEAVRDLCRRNPEFTFQPIDSLLPPAVLEASDLADQARQGYLQLLPHRHSCDGFFIARLKRQSQAAI